MKILLSILIQLFNDFSIALRIFIKFRTNQILGPLAEKDLLVTTAAYLKLLDRDFNFKKDFIYVQGEVLQDKA